MKNTVIFTVTLKSRDSKFGIDIFNSITTTHKDYAKYNVEKCPEYQLYFKMKEIAEAINNEFDCAVLFEIE